MDVVATATRRCQLTTVLAGGLWALLAGVQLRSAWDVRSPLPLLLALESGLVAYFLVVRRSAAADIPLFKKLASWGSVLLPLAVRVGTTSLIGQSVAVAGLALTMWGLVSLGQSFGIAPADRGLVTVGPYHLVRHPMYAGALLNALGVVLGNASIWNLGVWSALLISAALRIRWEEQTIQGYALYANAVRWRLLPGIW